MFNIFKTTFVFMLGFAGATSFADDGTTSSSNRGGLFVEPSISYETSSSSVNYPSPLSNSSGDVKGFGLGARFGMHVYESFFVGVDGRYSMPKFNDSSTNYSANATAYNWGPVVGMQMPNVGLRIWGSYVLGGELDPEKSGSYDVKFTGANGYRVGAGFRIASVSLNLEYQDLKYGSSTLQQIGPFSPGTNFDNVNLNNKTWLASVSFPIEL